MAPIAIALCLLLVHGALGAFDTFYNHEWRERLPSRPSAATELALHSARSWIFALTFAGLAWLVALQVVTAWQPQQSALVPTRYAYLSWLLTACAATTVAWAVRDGIAARSQSRAKALPRARTAVGSA